MSYKVGQKVCLWYEKVSPEGVVVLREVIVEIKETKTGVPGQLTRKPVSSMSLKGIGDDGKEYTKHWDSWPESQTRGYGHEWTLRDDGEGEDKYWVPREAVHAYNALKDRNEDQHGGNEVLERRDLEGNEILPKGDVVYCEVHDEYSHQGGKCVECHLATHKP